jgi:hypothetical protein
LTKKFEYFNPKSVTKLSEIWGFGIRDPEKLIPDPQVKKAPDTGSAAVTPEQNCPIDLSEIWIRQKK